MEPLVSIIIVTYKNFEYIEKVLDSIFMQDYPNIQLIITDDGSPNWEKAKPEIEHYIQFCKKANVKSIKLLHTSHNQGSVKNINNGMKNADGKYFKPIAQDDLLSKPDSITRFVKLASKSKTDVVCTAVEKIEEQTGRIIRIIPAKRRIVRLNNLDSKSLNRKFWNNCIIPATGTFYHRDIFERVGYYDEGYVFLEDHPFWIKISRLGEKIYFSDEILTKYRTGGMSSGSNPDLLQRIKEDYFRIIENEIEPYSSGLLFNIGNKLRRRRANFVFHFIEDKYDKKKILYLGLRYFDSAVYYFFRSIVERL